jgi:hypothetical protein
MAAIASLVIGNAASGEDLNPPPWRGEFCTTWQGWEFSDDNPAPPPDMGSYPYGDPYLLVDPMGDWIPVKGVAQGLWPLSGEIYVELWNHPIPNPYKEIWIQITWSPQHPDECPLVDLLDPYAGGPYCAEECVELDAATPLYHSTFRLSIEPNPEWESLRIYGTIDVDELIIDTRCVPEPATMAALAVGACLSLLRRRR